MNVKTRRVGNSLTVSIPKSFNIESGVIFEPIKTDKGILLQYVEEKDDFFDFDEDILKSVIEDGFSKNEIVEEFKRRKEQFPKAVQKYVDDATKDALSSKSLSREDFLECMK